MAASLCGAGRGPLAPGSWGSLAALPLAALSAWDWRAGLVLAVATFALAVAAAERIFRETGDPDPSIVVIDEAVGMVITSLGAGLHWKTLLTAFLLFRIFDVLKPPPCRRLEKLPGGWGIVMDDVMAGIYALAVLQLLLHRAPALFSL